MGIVGGEFVAAAEAWIRDLSIGSAAVFVLFAIFRAPYLARQPALVGVSARWLVAKLGAAAALFGLRCGVLVVTVKTASLSSLLAIHWLAIEAAASLLLLILVPLEHCKRRRPSKLAGTYLLCVFAYDWGASILLWSSLQRRLTGPHDAVAPSLFTAAAVADGILLVLENLRQQQLPLQEVTDRSPEEMSSILGLGFYAWLTSLFWSGVKNPLVLQDLFALDQGISVKTLDKQSGGENALTTTGSTTWQVLKWLSKPLGLSALRPVIPRLILLGTTFSQPFFLQQLLDYLSNDGREVAVGAAMAAAAVLIYLGIALSTSLYWYYQERFQSLLRGYLVSSIFRKTTKLPNTGDENLAAVTLMAADVDRIYTGVRFMHEIWINLIQIGLASWMLYKQLGLAFLSSLILILLGFGGSVVVARYASRYQSAWMKRVERRTGFTSNVLGNIKDLRAVGMTQPATELVQREREEEIEVGGRSRLLTAISAGISQVPGAMAPSLTFCFGPRVLNASRAYTALSFLMLLTVPLIIVLQVVPILATSMACLQRIKQYIDKAERLDTRHLGRQDAQEGSNEKNATANNGYIRVYDGSFGWQADNYVLEHVNISLPHASITFALGSIGDGKSTLCRALLGEIPQSRGVVSLGSNRVGYCAQTPFLFNTSIRSNIVGPASFDSVRYAEVLEATLLLEDLAQLPNGDETTVGTSGGSLSGGQRQRVVLARALYQEIDILILDDVFSGLDMFTQNQVCLMVLGDNGLVRKRGITAVFCTHAPHLVPVADEVLLLSSTRQPLKQISFADFSKTTQYRNLMDSDLRRKYAPQSDATGDRIKLQPAKNISNSQHATEKSSSDAETPQLVAMKPTAGIYRFWVSTIGPFPIVMFFGFVIGVGFCSNFSTIWLKFWSADSVSQTPAHSFAFWMGIYALLGAGTLLCVFPGGLIMLRTGVRLTGTHLHRTTIETAMHSSLRFLSTTEVGKVLNLFSQDTNILDTQLPRMVNNMCICLAMAIGQAAVIAASSIWLIISYPFLVALLWGVQRVYLPSSKRLRVLDLEAKAPLYTNFTTLIEGMTTIRSFGWLAQQIAENNELLDQSQRPSYLLAMAQQWLTLTMNMIVAALAVILVVLATQIGSNAGSIGAALVTLITLGELLSVVIVAYTGLETSLGAIVRLKRFSEETPQESSNCDDVVPDKSWPSYGHVQIQGVEASYNGTGKVLRGIDLNVEPGQSVAICGRTGSGKSTIMAVLLRLLDPLPNPNSSTPSSLTIDGLNLNTVNRTALRERIIADTQFPVFLPNGTTFRTNLDPWSQATPAECASAIHDVGLAAMMEAKGGLDASIDRAELSAGQRQLISLARVVLRRRVKLRSTKVDGGLLLLDEITASVDAATETRVRRILMEEFTAYTVLVVTHRMELARDCDRVITLEAGRIVEDEQRTIS